MSQEGTGIGVRGGKASSREGASHLLSDYRASSSEGILETGDMDKEDHNTGYRTEGERPAASPDGRIFFPELFTDPQFLFLPAPSVSGPTRLARKPLATSSTVTIHRRRRRRRL